MFKENAIEDGASVTCISERVRGRVFIREGVIDVVLLDN